jgi:hypothetical protein
VAAVFRGELAASFAKVGHCPITLDAIRHDEASGAVVTVLRVGRGPKATSRLAVSQKR